MFLEPGTGAIRPRTGADWRGQLGRTRLVTWRRCFPLGHSPLAVRVIAIQAPKPGHRERLAVSGKAERRHHRKCGGADWFRRGGRWLFGMPARRDAERSLPSSTPVPSLTRWPSTILAVPGLPILTGSRAGFVGNSEAMAFHDSFEPSQRTDFTALSAGRDVSICGAVTWSQRKAHAEVPCGRVMSAASNGSNRSSATE